MRIPSLRSLANLDRASLQPTVQGSATMRSATTTLVTTCRVQYVYTQPTPLLRARTSESRRLEKASATQAPANFSRKTALDPVHHQTKQGDLSVNSVVFLLSLHFCSSALLARRAKYSDPKAAVANRCSKHSAMLLRHVHVM